MSDVHLQTIARFRTACTIAALGGAAVSMAANVLASDGTPVGWAVGLTAPAGFILASEIAALATDLPRTRGTKVMLRAIIVLLVLIGGSAAVVSFGHLREVVGRVGETETAEILLALVVDAVAVMGLIGRHLTSTYLRRHEAAVTAKAEADRLAAIAAKAEAERQAAADAEAEAKRAARAAKRAERSVKAGAKVAKRPAGAVAGDDASLSAPERAVAIARANPGITQAEIGAVIGRGERTVRRYLNEADTAPTTGPTGLNGGGQGLPAHDLPNDHNIDNSNPSDDEGDEGEPGMEVAA
ncbi:MAG: hypothetical protein AAGD35_16070 [Actinomycetota bacterium]